MVREHWTKIPSPFRITKYFAVALVLLGCASRIYSLTLENPQLTGDASEYFAAAADLAYFISEGTPADRVVDRTPGLPALMAVLFLVSEESMALQRIATALLSCAVLITVVLLGHRAIGGSAALIAAAVIAPCGVLIANAPRGLTEELFSLLILLGLYIVLARAGQNRSTGARWLLGMVLAGLVATKTEGFLLVPALVVAMLLRNSLTARERLKHLVAMLVPPTLVFIAHQGYIAHIGAVPISYRGGNYLFFKEFLYGRMPWGYMRDMRVEQFRISYTDWLFDYHSATKIIRLGYTGLLAIQRMIVEAINWPGILLAAAGLAALVRDRQLLLPVVLASALSAYVLVLGVYPEGRYLLPALPLLALSAAAGYKALEGRWPWLRQTGYASPAVALLLSLATLWAPPAAAAAESHAISEAFRQCSLGFAALRRDDLFAAREAFTASLDEVSTCAPSHVGLATLSQLDGDQQGAGEHLLRAIEITPYYAEAYQMLANIEYEADSQAAVEHLRECIARRPDSAGCHLLRAKIDMAKERFGDALAGFERYMLLTRATHERALAFCNERVWQRQQAADQKEILDSENPLRSGMMTNFCWSYIHQATKEFTGLWAVDDADLGADVGLCHEKLGDLERALEFYDWHLALASGPTDETLAAHVDALSRKVGR